MDLDSLLWSWNDLTEVCCHPFLSPHSDSSYKAAVQCSCIGINVCRKSRRCRRAESIGFTWRGLMLMNWSTNWWVASISTETQLKKVSAGFYTTFLSRRSVTGCDWSQRLWTTTLQHMTQFAVAATNHSAFSSGEMRLDEMRDMNAAI